MRRKRGVGRRDFLRLALATGAAGGLVGSVERALAIPAASRHGSILDIEHVVILMQENRSFDQYFGCLGGVRGFDDPHPVPLSVGMPVWCQPDGKGSFVAPFRLDGRRFNAQGFTSLPHSWADGHAAWNLGRMDGWIGAKGADTMGYYTRRELPFHYALADAFTVCDGYFSSIMSATNPNRTFLMSGTNDPLGRHGGPILKQPLENAGFLLPEGPAFDWTTYPERLQGAGVSWRFYQGVDDDGPFVSDLQDAISLDPHRALDGSRTVSCFNLLRFFKQYFHAPAGSPLAENAMRRRPPSQFKADALSGRLPSVSWVFPPLFHSEHPDWTPAYGAMFIAYVLDALTANPETWSKTALLIMYDENDGYFDHVPPPTPPVDAVHGGSNVDTSEELIHADGIMPNGLGFRVPLLVVSPWSKGGAVCSQVFDHTSIIRFLEARFGVRESNISPWRREVCGDLTSAFDFRSPDEAIGGLPDTSEYWQLVAQQERLPVPEPDAGETLLPRQEPGARRERPLPYRVEASMQLLRARGMVEIAFRNTGMAGAVFHVFDKSALAGPWQFTVRSGSTLIGAIPVPRTAPVDLEIHGPAGFFRAFTG